MYAIIMRRYASAHNNRNNPGRWLYIAKLKPLSLSEHPVLPVSAVEGLGGMPGCGMGGWCGIS